MWGIWCTEQLRVQSLAFFRQPARQSFRRQSLSQSHQPYFHTRQVQLDRRAVQKGHSGMEIVNVVIPFRNVGASKGSFRCDSIYSGAKIRQGLKIRMSGEPNVLSHGINRLALM